MQIIRENARRDGLTDQEITFLEAYLAKHGVTTRAALVVLGGQPRWVCESVAEALDQLRPGCWLRQFSEQCHQNVMAELQLPIYKMGDDLAEHLQEEKDTPSALLAYAESLKAAARMVESLAQHAEWLKVEQADTHLILVSGPRLVVQALIDSGLLAPEQDTEDEDVENE